MDDTTYKKLLDEAFSTITEMLDEIFSKGDIDLSESDGVIEVTMENGSGVFVINRHVPTKQIWLSSPKTGAYHFVYDDASGKWLARGEELISIIRREILEK